jgi:hypothetical protein
VGVRAKGRASVCECKSEKRERERAKSRDKNETPNSSLSYRIEDQFRQREDTVFLEPKVKITIVKGNLRCLSK